MAADVVGYSRLMGEDEAGTLATLKRLRANLIDPTIAEYHGRMVKLMGDGALVEFASVVDAVECAVHIQKDMSEHNADTEQNNRIEFRIGINVGDIIIDGEDIYGDGVNVAARLEGEADPGGICISSDAYRQVLGKIDLAFEDSGERTLKNIAEPVRAYRWSIGNAAAPMETAPVQERHLSDKPSIAVLPFNNMSNDPDQEYFADGISEDLITDLSKLEGLTVIARNSSFTFKGRQVDVKEAAQTLGVRNILEGSVRKMGNKVRINAQLIDGVSGSHIWADRYDGSYEEIFDLQDEILEKIVSALEVNLTGRDRDKITHRATVNIDAYDLLLRGRTKFYAMNPVAFMQARDLFQQAIDIDPKFADAYTYLSFIEMVGYLYILPELGDDMSKARTLSEKAIALDDRSGMARTQLGWIQIWMGEHSLGIANLERGVEIDPTNAEGYAYLAEGLNYAGDPERAVEMTRKAQEYDPVLPPNCQFHLGHSYYLLGRFEEAAETISGALKFVPEFVPAHMILTAVYTELGQTEAAQKEIEIIADFVPKYTIAEVDRIYPHRPAEVKSRLLEALGKAGMRQN
jgi:TolB-like protein/Tfp pilus assembly protein PilF